MFYKLSTFGMFALAWMFLASSCFGQQMRIETEVLVGNSQELASKSLTLFDDQMIYDFLFTSEADSNRFHLEEIVVFDRLGQSITLLDQQRKTKLTISHTDLLSMSAAMKASEALRDKDLFLLEPVFEKTIDDNTKQLQLTSDRMNYHCRCESVTDPKKLLSYFHFADWAARLNVSDSRKMPPFARLILNESLRKRGWIPLEVELDLLLPNSEKLRAKATHNRLEQLSQNDQIRIQQAVNQVREFKATSLTEYRNLESVSAR